MKEILQDIVSHTHNLGFLNLVKIIGDNKTIKIDSIADDRSVVMLAETAGPVPELEGSYGMAQMNKLKFLLDLEEYKENAKMTVVKDDRNDEEIPIGINFENEAGDFKNHYSFMNFDIVSNKIKAMTFRGATWDIEVTPSLQAINRFKYQAAANSEHTTFIFKTENGDLKCIFGTENTFNGEFVFATGVKGKINKSVTWPVANVLSILKIADTNKCTLSIADGKAIQITLDSGLATYKYVILANV